MKNIRCMCIPILLLFTLHITEGALNNTEQRLIKHLFASYNKQSRPVLHPTVAVNVSFGIEIAQLIKVDDRNQFITTKLWVRQSWNNSLMSWNPADWDGIKFVLVDGDQLWTPDVILYNSADDSFTGSTEKYKTRIIINSSGKQSWLAPATFTSTCAINIRYFPFDQQTCKLKFGSWTYDKDGIVLIEDPRPVITSQYVNSSEWDITSAVVELNDILYECCTVSYMDTTFTILLKRKPLYYIFNVILPCIVLVITILFGFFLPPESGERISLTITILLAVAVFLQLISDALPRNSDSIPILGVFYMVVMAESAMSLITTCVVLIIHYRSSEKGVKPMKPWIRKMFLKNIAKFLCVRVTVLDDQDLAYEIHKVNGTDNGSFKHENPMNGTYKHHSDNDDGSIENIMLRKMKMRKTQVDGCENESTLDAILNEIQMVTSTIEHKNKHEEIEEEWRCLAKVLDRIFFWVFLFTIFVSSISILLPAYYRDG